MLPTPGSLLSLRGCGFIFRFPVPTAVKDGDVFYPEVRFTENKKFLDYRTKELLPVHCYIRGSVHRVRCRTACSSSPIGRDPVGPE